MTTRSGGPDIVNRYMTGITPVAVANLPRFTRTIGYRGAVQS